MHIFFLNQVYSFQNILKVIRAVPNGKVYEIMYAFIYLQGDLNTRIWILIIIIIKGQRCYKKG